MKTTKHILTLALTLFCALGTTYAINQTYYTSIDGKSGSTLRDALYTLTAKGPQNMTYNGLWTAYKTTDVYPSDSTDKAGKIWDMYSNVLFTAGTNQCGTYSNVGDCYNREHSLPKSWFNEATPAYYDLGHIVPTDGKVNGQRSNYPFGECASGTRLTNGNKKGLGKLGTSTFSGYTSVGKVFEPDDIYKGDFARMYMYMAVRYKKGNSNNVNLAADSDGQKMFNSTDDNFGFTDYSIALLMKWHRQDPVSVKEVLRNNGMEKVQGNRNPFIDYPDLAEYLWGNQKNQSVTLSSLSIATGGSSTPTLYDVILNRNGATEQISTSGTYNLPTDEDAACDGWAFAGWSTSSSVNTTTAPSFTTSVSSAATLYAVYSHTTSSAPHRAKMADTWTRVTSMSTLTGGGTFIMGYEATAKSGTIIPLRSKDCNATTSANGYFNTGTTSGSSNNGTLDMTGAITSTDYEVYISSPASGKINIQMVNSSGNYYGATSGGTTSNKAKLYTAGNSNETNLTVEWDSETDNTFKLSANVSGTYKYLKYNIQSPRFAFYNSAGDKVVFYKKESGSSGGSTTTYKTTPDCGSAHTITLSNGGSVNGGTFEASATSAYQGATITLYADPNDGYELDSWTVTAGGSPVAVNDNQFTMPDANVTVSATFNALPTHAIRFFNNGTQIGTTQSIYAGGYPDLPSDPEAPCEDYTFVGWWTSTLAASNTESKTWVTDFTVSDAQDYYAVFSKTETSGSGTPVPATLEASYSSHEGWTISGTGGSSYWILKSDATITSPEITDLSTVTSITFTARTYGGASFNTVNVKAGSNSVGSATASSTNMVSKTINVSGLTGSGSFVFSSSTTSSANGPGINNIVINYATGGSSSTTYYTSSPSCTAPCSNTPTMSFANATVSKTTADASFTQAVTISGKGAGQTVAYSSSDETIATVNNSGVVTLLGKVGSTTITASVEEVGEYCEASASYTINVTQAVCALTGISLNTEDVSLIYTTGDAFSAEELIVTATYSNCADKEVIPTSISTPDMSSAGTKTVTVTYTENGVTKEATFDIEVSAPVTYTVTWNANGTETAVVYNEDDYLVLPSTPSDCEGTGGKKFVGWTASSPVDGSAPADMFTTASGIVTADKTYYAVFATATTTGSGSGNYELVEAAPTNWAGDYLIAYSNEVFADGRTGGTNGIGKQNSSVTPGDNLSGKEVAASWGDTYKVTIEESATSGKYLLKTQDGKYNYQSSNSNGVAATDNKSTAEEHPLDITFNKSSDVAITVSSTAFHYNTQGYFRFYKDAGQSVVYLYKKTAGGAITYSNYSLVCDEPCTLTSITLNTSNVTTSFTTGDTFTSAGLVVTANYSNCASKTVTPASISSPDMTSAGTKTVTVSYTENGTTKTATYSITVNAPISYTITLDNNGSVTGGTFTASPASATAGTTITLTATAATGYRFVSWSVTQGSTPVAVSGNRFAMPAGDVTVSATFEAIPRYTIRFFDNGSQIGSSQSVYEGSLPDVPADPTPCEGYTFVGWWTEELASTNTESKSWVDDFTVSKAQDYYAIFSHTEGSSGGSSTVTFEKSDFSGSGTISASKSGVIVSCVGNIPNGAYVTFTENNTLTITSSSGNITAIDFTCTESAYTGNMEDVSNISTSSWSISVDNPGNKTTVRVSSIIVTIGSGSSSNTYYTSSPNCVVPCTKLETPVVAAVAGNGQITLTWAEVANADHYTVTIGKGVGYTTECGTTSAIGSITGTTIKTCVITDLTNGLTYTTRVVANAADETCDSEASEVSATPTECEEWTDPTLTWSAYNLNTTGTNTATCSISGTTHGTRSFESSNTEVLTVASDGTVTAVGAGTATVTVSWTAADGYCEKSIISDAFEVAGPLTISFDANGGEGTMSDQTVTYKVSTTIKDNSFTRTGYTFQGWALTAAGSKEYNDKQSVAFTNSLTLYAVWQLNSHEVTFTSSVTGATVTVNGQSSSPQTAEYGSTVTLLITPTEHYIVSALTVSGTSGSVDISGTGNTRTFTMPDEAVTVTLTMVAESQYTATFYNGAETFATVSGYADDDIAAPTSTPTSCDDETFTFIGWVATAQASEVTTCPEILTFPQVMTSGGVSYYALFRRSEGGSGGEASVTFKTASSDSNTEYTTDSDIKTHIVDNYTGIASFEGSKSYPGKSGVKLGSSKNAGSITLTLSSPITTDKITVEAEKYGTDAGDLKIEVNGNTTFGSALSPAGGTLEFTDDEMEISSLTVLTTTARAYVASISLGGGGTSYYTTAPECAACENQVTITKGTAEHGTFQLSKADGSYDNCKNNVSVTVSNITPDYGYYCSGVTATGSHMHVAVSGPDGSGNYTVAYAKGYSITSTINVVFEPLPTYTIRFIDNASIISTQTIYDGAKAVKPTDPTPCDGYTFVGWWTAELDADNTTSETWVSDFTASQDQDYYAVYRYTETNSGSSSTPVTKTMSAFTAVSGNVDGDENISYVAAKGGAANDPAINSEEIRIYQNGGTLTVTANNSKKITAVTIGSSMATSVTYAIDGGSASDNQAIAADGTLPLSDLNASSILFTCTGTDKNHRLYLNYLSVTYSDGGSSGGTTTTYYTTAPDCEAPIVTSAKMLVVEYGGARVALAHDNTNIVAALPMMYFNENYICPDKDKQGNPASAPEKATLTWQVAERTDGYYIKSGDKFLAATGGAFTLQNEKFLWSKDRGTRLAYNAEDEKFVADEQGDLPGIMPVDIQTTIYQTSLNSQRSGLTIGYFGTICLPHAVALPFTWGVKVYSIKAKKMTDGLLSGIYIVEETEMLTAGKPYLIEALATNMTMWYPTGAEIVNTPVEALGLVGNLGTTSVYVPIDCYGISNNKLRRVAAENTATIGQYKAYIDLTGVPVEGVGTTPMQSVYKVLYTAEEENVATNTEQLFDATGINWNEPVYNILGIRVDRNCTGVLIQNGKKFLVTHPRP